MKKQLLVLLLLGCLTMPAFAVDDSSLSSRAIKEIITTSDYQNITPDNLNDIFSDYYKKRNNGDYKHLLTTINYIVEASKNLYGENNIRTLEAINERADFNSSIFNMTPAIEDFNYVINNISQNEDTDLKDRALIGLGRVYMILEQQDEALEVYKQISGTSQISNFFEISNAYFQQRNNKEAINYLNTNYKKIKNPDLSTEFEYYKTLAQIYHREGNYKLVSKYISKSENCLSKMKTPHLGEQIGLDFLKLEYYLQIENYTELKKILAWLEENAKHSENLKDGEGFYNLALGYNSLLKNKEETNKYYKILTKYYSEFPNESLMRIFYKEPMLIYYRETGELEKANQLADEILTSIEPIKDEIPIWYSKFLKYAFENKLKEGDYPQAEEYLDEALTYYKKYIPDSLFEYRDIYTKYGDLYTRQNKIEKAIQAYNKAIKYAELSDCKREMINIYNGLAIAYRKTDNEKSISYINKAIETAIECYGENSSRTYRQYIEKYYILNDINKTDDAALLLSEITNNSQINGIVGNVENIKYMINLLNCKEELRKNNYENALLYADEASKNITSECDKKKLYKLYYKIYTGNGNLVKAVKYKKLGTEK